MRISLVDYVTLPPAQREQLALIQVDAAQREFSSDITRGLAVLLAHTGNDAARSETFHGRVGEERRLTLPL
ncbi:MAG: hypothetical protein WCA48_04315 [Pseudomonas gingeri]